MGRFAVHERPVRTVFDRAVGRLGIGSTAELVRGTEFLNTLDETEIVLIGTRMSRTGESEEPSGHESTGWRTRHRINQYR